MGKLLLIILFLSILLLLPALSYCLLFEPLFYKLIIPVLHRLFCYIAVFAAMKQAPTHLNTLNAASTSSYQPPSAVPRCDSSCPRAGNFSSLRSQQVLPVNFQARIQQFRKRTILPGYLLTPLLLLLIILLPALAEGSARCYFFGPGTTIAGSDYRRDYRIENKACAETCKFDACCLAFEWQKTDGVCTLKSRSLNGTVEPAGDDTYFGLCLDYEDAERDRFWDHELLGPSIASAAGISRDKCSAMCASTVLSGVVEDAGTQIFNARKRGGREPIKDGARAQPNKQNAVIYSWKTENEKDVDAMFGTCECISILHGVRLSFGSFSGFLL